MSGPRRAALAAAAKAIHEAGCGYVQCAQAGHPDISGADRDLAEAALEAAEQAWPHNPPKRDPASATGGSFTIRTAPQQATAFGFGTPGAYPGGATVDEGYRDEKWQDAQT